MTHNAIPLNNLEGKLYATDGHRNQIAVYVRTERGFKPEWQTVSEQAFGTIVDEMRAFRTFRDCMLIYYDTAAQCVACDEYLKVKARAEKMLTIPALVEVQ